MTQATIQKIRVLEEELRTLRRNVDHLWAVLDDEVLWRPSVINAIRKRSQDARRRYRGGKLGTVDEFFRAENRNV